MKPYNKYKDCDIEWIGTIPVEWDLWKISHAFSQIGSGTTPKSDNEDYYNDGIINWVLTGDLNDSFLYSTSKKITNKALSDYSVLKIYPKGSLVMAMYGATIGKLSILGLNAATNQACCVISEDETISIRFLYYWLLVNRRHIISLSYGGGQPNISQEIIKGLKLQTPPIPEQTAIANFLDHKTQLIDDLIAKKERLIELLREERTAMINQAVTRGLPAEARAKAGLDPNVPMKDTGIEWLGEIPEHWGFAKIKRYTKIETGGTPSRTNTEYWENGTINWLSSGEVNKAIIYEVDNKITILGLEKSNARILPENTIMIALNGQGKTKGMTAILKVKSTCNQSLAGFICDETTLHYRFLFYVLQNKYKNIRGLVGDESREGLSLELLRKLYIQLPSLSEQIEISDYFEKAESKIANNIESLENQLILLKEYTTSLINEAVTGKIDVRDFKISI